jgi:hypothetical protein
MKEPLPHMCHSRKRAPMRSAASGRLRQAASHHCNAACCTYTRHPTDCKADSMGKEGKGHATCLLNSSLTQHHKMMVIGPAVVWCSAGHQASSMQCCAPAWATCANRTGPAANKLGLHAGCCSATQLFRSGLPGMYTCNYSRWMALLALLSWHGMDGIPAHLCLLDWRNRCNA